MADGVTTFLQYSLISKFLLPFLLVFFILFAILEKTKVLGEKKNIHALVAFIVGLIFVTAVYPKLVVANLILLLTVSLVAVFVILLVWGFIFGNSGEPKGLQKGLIIGLGIIATIALIIGIIWATGFLSNLQEFLSSGIGNTILINVVFLVVIGIALAVLVKSK